MSNFNKAFDFIVKHEGGFSDDPDDRGGATDYGISLRFLKSLGDSDNDGYLDGDINFDGMVDARDIHALTREKAADKYHAEFWTKYGYSQLQDSDVAAKVIDLSVNMGPYFAHVVLQSAISVHNTVKVDGIIGPKTIQAANALRKEWLLVELCHYAAQRYLSLGNPKFLKGWLNRAYDLP